MNTLLCNYIQANPCDDWATKYKKGRGAVTFTDDEISTCGRHILEVNLLDAF